MANFPMVVSRIPITLNIEDTYTKLSKDDCEIIIRADGDLIIKGSIKSAALCLFNFIVEKEYTYGIVSLELNKCIRVDFNNGFKLICLKKEKPACFDELASEFQKIYDMRAFW